MSLFVRLLDEIDDVGRPVSAVLLKARRLAEELPGRKFKAWVQLEMNGYQGTSAEVPGYRVIGVMSVGSLIGPTHKLSDYPLPLDTIPEPGRTKMAQYQFLDGAGALEGFLQTKRENVHCAWPEFLIEFYRRYRIPGMPVGFHLIEAYQLIPVLSIQGVLYAIRSRLLEFVLQLGRDCPDLKTDDAAIALVPEARVETLVQQVIIEGNNAPVSVFLAKQQVQASGINVGGDFVVSDDVSDSFKGGPRE